MKTKYDAVIVLSGGLDSSTCLGIAVERFGKDNVLGLSVEINQYSGIVCQESEMKAAARICEHYGVDHHIVKQDLPSKYEGIAFLLMGRNAALVMQASCWANSVGAKYIYYGANASDYKVYADCREDFVEAVNRLNEKSETGVTLLAPLMFKSKTDIIEEAVRVGMPIEKTFSCYEPPAVLVHCEKCDSCSLRFKSIDEYHRIKSKVNDEASQN